MLLFGAFIIGYRMELILSFPFVTWMIRTYFEVAFTPQSSVQNAGEALRGVTPHGRIFSYCGCDLRLAPC
jgi:hypothetical protein